MTSSVDAVVLRLVKEWRRVARICRESVVTPEDLDRMDKVADSAELRVIKNARDVIDRTQNDQVLAQPGETSTNNENDE